MHAGRRINPYVRLLLRSFSASTSGKSNAPVSLFQQEHNGAYTEVARIVGGKATLIDVECQRRKESTDLSAKVRFMCDNIPIPCRNHILC